MQQDQCSCQTVPADYKIYSAMQHDQCSCQTVLADYRIYSAMQQDQCSWNGDEDGDGDADEGLAILGNRKCLASSAAECVVTSGRDGQGMDDRACQRQQFTAIGQNINKATQASKERCF